MSQYIDEKGGEINEKLNDLAMTYDNRLLSAVLLNRAANTLQLLHAAGIFKADDIKKMIDFAFERVLDPLPAGEHPQVITAGYQGSGKPN